MTGRIVILLALVATIAACGRVAESRFNPLNWFGRSEAVTTNTANPYQDPRPLVSHVSALRLEKVPGGAIIRATGVAERQGYYDGELVQIDSGEPGVLAFQFRVAPPFGQTRAGPQRSRELIVGLFVSDQALEGVRAVSVSAANNALAARR